MNAAVAELRTRLLRKTLEIAAQSSAYYKRILSTVDPGTFQLSDLSAIPSLTKELAARHSEDLLTSNSIPVRIGLTSGTTYDRSSDGFIGRCYQSESEAIEFDRLTESLKAGFDIERPLSIQLPSQMHGAPFAKNPPGTFVVPLLKHFVSARQLVRDFRWDTGDGKMVSRGEIPPGG
jgi:hypothetical protein